jgi:5-methyltetrahydrofolate--homocysteine methyltransferase
MSKKELALEAVAEAFGEVLGTDEVQKRVEAALENSASPTEVIQSLGDGVEIVGRKYQAQEYFLSDLIMAGLMAEQVITLLRPRLATSSKGILGRVVIGTVRGDIHDVGKKLVSAMLVSAGFDLVDVGVDVSAEDFVGAARKYNPRILAMSCLLTSAMDEMKQVVERLGRTDLRSNLKVLVGGRPISEQFVKEVGADGYGADAIEAVKAARNLLSQGDVEES